MAVGAVVARIISQYSDKGSKAAQRDIAKLGKNIDKFAARVTKAFAVAAAASAAFAVKIGKDAVKAAIDDSKSANVLAMTLQNVTGATRETIDAVEDYIKRQQMLAGVADDELRQSLGALVAVTGDATTAMDLQSVALDTAAGTGKSLQTVTMALVRAQQGNLTSLKRLGVPLDDTIIKNKDLGAAVAVLTKTYGGQAEVLGDTDPLKRLQLAYGEILETLGYALLPVVVEFTEYLQTDVLPAIEEWIVLNEEQLQNGLRQTVEIIKDLADRAVDFAKFVNANKELIGTIAGVLAALKGYALAVAAIGAFKVIAETVKIITVRMFGTGAAAAKATPKLGLLGKVIKGLGTAVLFLSRVFMALPGPIKLVLIGLTAATAAYSRIKGSIDKATKSTVDFATAQRLSAKSQRDGILEGFKPIEAATKLAAEKAARDTRLSKIRATQNAREQKDLAKQIELEKQLARLKKFGITTKEDDPVQLNAAIALQKRQKDIDKLDVDRLERMKEELISLKVRNDLATRYQDILKALADTKIDDKELVLLAKLWDVPVEAAKTYIESLFAIEDATISDDEVIKLAMAWGSTEEQAAKYLDFYKYLNDGVLSTNEIDKLISRWGMTEQQVRMYADFVGVVNDGKLNDAEIIKIQDKWKLTTDQVLGYIRQIGAPVSYSGTLVDPARAAELGWLNAADALKKYRDLLNVGAGAIISGNVAIDPTITAEALAAAQEATNAALEAAAIAAEADKAAAEAEAAASAVSGLFLNAIKEARTQNAINEAVQVAQVVGESASNIANAMMVGLLGQGMDAATAGSTARYTGMAIAAQQSGLGGLDRMITDAEFDQTFRGISNPSSTVNTAQSINTGSLAAAPVVNITIQGSVTAEQDLVQAVRNGLLATQYNGNQLLLEAI